MACWAAAGHYARPPLLSFGASGCLSAHRLPLVHFAGPQVLKMIAPMDATAGGTPRPRLCPHPRPGYPHAHADTATQAHARTYAHAHACSHPSSDCGDMLEMMAAAAEVCDNPVSRMMGREDAWLVGVGGWVAGGCTKHDGEEGDCAAKWHCASSCHNVMRQHSPLLVFLCMPPPPLPTPPVV